MEQRLILKCDDDPIEILHKGDGTTFDLTIGEKHFRCSFRSDSPNRTVLHFEDGTIVSVAHDRKAEHFHVGGSSFLITDPAENSDEDSPNPARKDQHFDGKIKTPMPGKVVKICVRVGQTIDAGGDCVIIEAMKMEHTLGSPKAGIVRAIHCAKDDQVPFAKVLVEVEPNEGHL